MLSSATIFSRLWKGIKKAHYIPTLPEHILKFHSHILVRIFRVIGGVSFLLVMGRANYFSYPVSILYIAMCFVILLTIYHFILSYFRIKHIIKILKSDQLDIRNSPPVFASIFDLRSSIFDLRSSIFELRSSIFDLRSSKRRRMDNLARFGARAILCFKGACEQAQPAGFALGAMMGVDEIKFLKLLIEILYLPTCLVPF